MTAPVTSITYEAVAWRTGAHFTALWHVAETGSGRTLCGCVIPGQAAHMSAVDLTQACKVCLTALGSRI